MIQQILQAGKDKPIKLYSNTKEWAVDYYKIVKPMEPIDRAIFGGFQVQQFSFAFMAGYQAALEQMFPTVAPNELKALCVSEKDGNHPKAITTLLTDNKITGLKTYVTAGSEVKHLIVLCKTDEVLNDRPVLKMIYLPNPTESIQISDFELPFMQEVKHGKLSLNGAKINSEQILEGDGYTDYTKPFRTLEDICVGAAYQAMLLRQAFDCNWDADLRDKIVLNLYTLKNLIKMPYLDSETLLLLAAQEQHFETLLPEIEKNIASHSSSQFQSDWEKNKKVLSMAKKIKAIRLAKARETLFG